MLVQKGPAAGSVRFVRSESNSALQARILNAADAAIKLRLPTPVQDGEPVDVELAPGFHEKGRILYCRQQSDGFDVVVELRKDNQRKEVRVEDSKAAFLCDLETTPGRGVTAEVVDLSDSGLGVLTSMPLQVGSLVSVATDDFFVLGEVRHCTPTRYGNSYRSGIRTERLTVRDQTGGATQAAMDSGKRTLPLPSFSDLVDSLKRLLAV
jgi:hypothetical protein